MSNLCSLYLYLLLRLLLRPLHLWSAKSSVERTAVVLWWCQIDAIGEECVVFPDVDVDELVGAVIIIHLHVFLIGSQSSAISHVEQLTHRLVMILWIGVACDEQPVVHENHVNGCRRRFAVLVLGFDVIHVSEFA